MQLTKNKLRRMIKEELQATLAEQLRPEDKPGREVPEVPAPESPYAAKRARLKKAGAARYHGPENQAQKQQMIAQYRQDMLQNMTWLQKLGVTEQELLNAMRDAWQQGHPSLGGPGLSPGDKPRRDRD
jgi:hypothetical protein